MRWTLDEEPLVTVQSPGLFDIAVWRQERSMTVRLVNLTNPMYMKGPFREFLPVDADLRIITPPVAPSAPSACS